MRDTLRMQQSLWAFNHQLQGLPLRIGSFADAKPETY